VIAQHRLENGETYTGNARRRERAWGGRKSSRSEAVLSELLVKVAGKPLQDEVSAVRVLPELLRFLLEASLVVCR